MDTIDSYLPNNIPKDEEMHRIHSKSVFATLDKDRATITLDLQNSSMNQSYLQNSKIGGKDK